jgi:hypothetical protein
MPEQDDLPDRDPKAWPKINGTVKDPWTLQAYLVFENVRTGETVLYCTGSKGGRKAIGQLVRTATTNSRRGSAIVKLASSSYRHKDFGDVLTPVFETVSWTNATNRELEPMQEDMNADLPF